MLDKRSLKHLWLRAYGYIDDIGAVDAASLERAERIFDVWFKCMEPLIGAISHLNSRIDHINNGCQMCQTYFKEALEQCRNELARG
jgi:hypothetical protein